MEISLYRGSFSYILLLLELRRSFVISRFHCILFFRYDPRELDVVLREVVIMNSRAEMYLKFIEKRISVRTFYVEFFKKNHHSSLAHYPSCRTTSLLPLLISLCKGKSSFKPYQNEHQGNPCEHPVIGFMILGTGINDHRN